MPAHAARHHRHHQPTSSSEIGSSPAAPPPATAWAMEPAASAAAVRGGYTCPMHPEVVRDAPGACPICGMALEPRTVVAEESNPELAGMTRRLWLAAALSLPLLLAGMADLIPGQPLQHAMPAALLGWGQMLLATPVVLWAPRCGPRGSGS